MKYAPCSLKTAWGINSQRISISPVPDITAATDATADGLTANAIPDNQHRKFLLSWI